MTAQHSTDAALQIRLMGGFELRAGERIVLDSSWNRRKAKALLKLLALKKGQALHREQVLDALWPELEPSAAANNLYKNLHYLRAALREQGITTSVVHATADLLALWDSVGVDVDRFCAAAARASAMRGDPALYEEALAYYGGELLPEDRYEDWAEPRREQLRGMRIQLLGDLSRLYEEAGEIGLAAERLQQVVATDPLHEEAHSALMRLFARSRRRHRAIRQYQICREALQRELGIEPSAATQAAYRRILAERGSVDQPARTNPPLQSIPTNLPAALTSFIGRQRELSEITHLLSRTRLLTLTGAGGSGKTRLALEIARRVSGVGCREPELAPDTRHPTPPHVDGIWLVELGAVSDPCLVAPTLAAALGLREEPGVSVTSALVAHLRPKRALIVLDNCEHLLTACAVFVQQVLSGCPRLTILATSREALGIPGEVAWPVPALPVPFVEQAASLKTLLQTPSVRLFVERATAWKPSFQLTDQNAPTVVQICRRLDGIPLALELAAARIIGLSVPQIAARLEDRFSLLVGGSRAALPRQQTLRATIDWGYALLTESEQALFCALSILPGIFSIEAAEAIGVRGQGTGDRGQGTGDSAHPPEARLSGPTGDRDRTPLPSHLSRRRGRGLGPSPAESLALSPESSSVLDLLGKLVTKSLLVAVEGSVSADEVVQYRLLETLREYGREQLRSSGETEAVEERLIAYCLRLAAVSTSQASGSRLAEWLERMDREYDTLREGLSRLARRRDALRGLQLATLLRDFWDVRGYLREGRGWLAEFLALPAPECRGERRGQALLAVAILAFSQGDGDTAKACAEESLTIFRPRGDQLGIADALYYLSLVSRSRGDYAAARSLAEQSLSLARATGDKHATGVTLRHLGKVAARQGEYATAHASYHESLAIERSLENGVSIAVLLCDLADLACTEAEFTSARDLYEESLRIQRSIASWRYIPACLEGVARVEATQGEEQRAARLLGASAALREAISAPLPPSEQPELDQFLLGLRTTLGEPAFSAALADGRALNAAQSIPYALHEPVECNVASSQKPSAFSR